MPFGFGRASSSSGGGNVGGVHFSAFLMSAGLGLELVSGRGSKNGSIVLTPSGPWIFSGRPISVASSLAASSSALAALALSACFSGEVSVPGLAEVSGSMSALTRWPFSRPCSWRKFAICLVIAGDAIEPFWTAPVRRSVADLISGAALPLPFLEPDGAGLAAASATIASWTALNMPSGRGSAAIGRTPCSSVPNVRVTLLGLDDNARLSIAAIFSFLAVGSMPMCP